jgi:Ran GTPase-activating protein (RanGAP) involved in mRNA processing and transport
MPLDEDILQRLCDNDTTLTQLDLGHNQISVEGAKALAGALEQNTTLIQLDLWDNQIGDEGAKALAAALEQNTTLIQLDLWDNQIGDEGAKALAAALEQNTALIQLDLWDNQIGDEGAKALAAALEQNTTLTQLNLRNNPISANVKKQIERLIERNQRLLKELQATAFKQFKAGRVLLRNALPADNNTVSLANLPLEIREHVVKVLDGEEQVTEEQQRLILNYAEGKITLVADKLQFFKIMKCDRVRKQLRKDEIEATEQKLTQLTV